MVESNKMTWQKIRSALAIGLFLFLALFFAGTTLLGLKNNPNYLWAVLLVTVLVLISITVPFNSAANLYNPLKDYKTLVMLVLITLIPRGVWIASIHPNQVSDFKFYHRLASSLAEGSIRFQSYIRTFPHVLGYTFVLSVLYRLIGSTVLTAQVFNSVLFVAIVLAVFFLASQTMDKRFAVLTAVIVALWPSQLFFTTLVSSEALFTLLFIVCIGLFYSIRNTTRLLPGLALFGLLGVLVAVTNAVRPLGYLFLIASLVYYFIFVSQESRGIRPWIMKLVCYGFLCLGYLTASSFIHYLTVRTAQGSVAKSFLGYYILVGSNINSGGTWNEADAQLQASIYQDGQVDPNEVNQILLRSAISRITASPGEFLKLQLPKNKAMWQDDSFGIYWNKTFLDGENPGIWSPAFLETMVPISNIYYYTILICCILGSLLGAWNRERGLMALIGLILLGTILIFVFTEVQARYHYYALPLFALLAGYGLNELNRIVQQRKQLKTAYNR